jgi:hypothetical protein
MRKQCIGIASFISVFCLAGSAAQASNTSCDGKAGYYSYSCADPASNEVVVYGDAGGTGKCMRFSSTFTDSLNSPHAPPGYIPDLTNYGFNDCISSVKVGSNVRLIAFQDAYYNPPIPPRIPNHNWDWQMATYEPDAFSPWYAEPTVADDFSSLIIQDISQSNGERIPHRYIGSDPTSDNNAWWSQEPQGLCHNKTSWFLTQEVDVSGTPINPNFSCVADGNYDARVWKVPRNGYINGAPPAGTFYRDLKDMPAQFSTWSGYRHFGDPDCQTISGRDYVFIPVQSCASNSGVVPIPYVLVLDSDLNFVAGWTIPPQPSNYDITPLATCMGVPLDSNVYWNIMGGHGMGAWVAVRPSSALTESSVEVWMGTDICNGLGMQRFTGTLTAQGSVPMAFKLPAPVIMDMGGTPENFGAIGGGTFSPSGQTFYMATGDMSHLGGVRVINPNTGQELTETGNQYGPFDYQHQLNYTCTPFCITTGQETEGLDFLDTRCPGTPVASTGAAGQSSQLHVVMNHNGLSDSGDQVEVRHYSVAANAPNPMCEPMLFDKTSNPGISSQGGGTLDVFAIAGGRVFQRPYNAGWAPTWTPLPSIESPRRLVGKPASVSWGPGRIDIFAHDDLGTIRHLWSNSGYWNPSWETIAATGRPCSLYPYCNNLTVSSWGPNRLDIFDTTTNSTGGLTIMQITYNNGWNAPRRPFGDAPPATGAISAVSWGPGRIDFVATPEYSGGVYQVGQYYSNDGVTFYGPFPLGGVGSVFTVPTNVALSSWAYSDIEVVTMGAGPTASIVGQRGFRPGTAWGNWTTSSLSPEASPVWPSQVSSTSSGNNRIDIVYGRPDPTGSTTTVWHAWYNNVAPVGWFGPEQL